MKTILNLSLSVIFLFSAFAKAQLDQQQEVFIIGTMHKVPKIVKNAYKPLLKIATRYQPDAIYAEYVPSSDSLSLLLDEGDYFVPLSDSIASIFKNDNSRTTRLLNSEISSMSKDDFEYLKNYHASKKEMANWNYYRYLENYGVNGSKDPLRHENGDLTAKLAIEMDMKQIFSMDYQREALAYNELWQKCVSESKKDGQVVKLVKENKSDYRKHMIPGALGNLGKYSNRVKTMKRYVRANRFEFRDTPCEPCEEAGNVWDRRNAGMAKNIGDQVLDNSQKRAIVIVGAGHVLGIKAELEKQFPEIRVKIIDEK